MELNTLINLNKIYVNTETNTELNTELNIDGEDEKEIIIKKYYDYNKKMDLVKKINKIKKKEYLLNIFKIILLYNKDYTENNNGIFIFFHNLDNEAYEQIENYVNKIYKMHKKSPNILNFYNSEISDKSINLYSDIIEIKNNKDLSNKEKFIMKRKKYENYLDQNQDK